MPGGAKIWIPVGVASLAVLLGVVWWLNQGYREVSDQGYAYAMALISVCNRQDNQRLRLVEEQIIASKDAGELTDYDFRILQRIVQRAANGNWEAASASIRRLMQDQVWTE